MVILCQFLSNQRTMSYKFSNGVGYESAHEFISNNKHCANYLTTF